MCAVMVLVAAAPLALATHDVIKGAQGPRASAVTWEYTPPGLGVWTGHIVNTGLRSLVVDVYDSTGGIMDQVSHQRIRFAAYDALPSGVVDTEGTVMATGHVYSITVTPNGPQGASCTVDDMWRDAMDPVAIAKLVSKADLTVSVSGSDSYDTDGTVVGYMWNFGDGATAATMDATHTFATAGMKTITLTVTDNDGLTDDAVLMVEVSQQIPPPTASFTATVNGFTVNVDASASTGSGLTYAWNWGDGTTGSGVTASHSYAQPTSKSTSRAPPVPHPVYGFTYKSDGVTPMNDCLLTFTNVRTGESFMYAEEAGSNAYVVDASMFVNLGYVDGDLVRIDATAAGGFSGTAQYAINLANDMDGPWNVLLQSSGGTAQMTITLTVTDSIGRTASVSQVVEISW